MEQNEKQLSEKLLAVQKKLQPIIKDGTNPFFNNSKYATLTNILSAIKPIMSEAGLVIIQPIKSGSVCTTIIDSATGQTVTSELPLPVNLDAQKIGSAITYFRRYTLASLLSLEIEDDDGNSASQPEQKAKPQPKADDGKPWLTEKQFKDAKERIGAGERDLFDKLIIAFKMKKEYRAELEQLANTF